MSLSWRFLSGVGATFAVLGLGFFLRPACTNFIAQNLGDFPKWGHALEEATEHAFALDAQQRAVHQRMESKNQVAWEVIAGRLPLTEAAARFRDLCSSSPYFNEERYLTFNPGVSDEERYCRVLIAWVRMVLYDRPEHAREVATRLEAELAKRLLDGPLQLP